MGPNLGISLGLCQHGINGKWIIHIMCRWWKSLNRSNFSLVILCIFVIWQLSLLLLIGLWHYFVANWISIKPAVREMYTKYANTDFHINDQTAEPNWSNWNFIVPWRWTGYDNADSSIPSFIHLQNFSASHIYTMPTQIANTFISTSIWYESDAKVSDRYLINIDPGSLLFGKAIFLHILPADVFFSDSTVSFIWLQASNANVIACHDTWTISCITGSLSKLMHQFLEKNKKKTSTH